MMIQFEPKYKERNGQWISIAQQLWDVKKLLKHYAELEENLLILLKEESNNEPSMGGGFVFDAIERKGSIDYQSIPGIKLMDLEAFRKPNIVSWKLSKD